MGQSVTQTQFWTGLRYLLFFAGTWLATHGYIKDADVNGLVSAILMIAPPVWAFVDNWLKERSARARETVAVRAGVAHAEDITVPTIPPPAVSPKEAQAIIATYAPEVKA